MIRTVQAPPNQRCTAQLSRTFAAQYFIRVSFFTRAKVSLANFAFSETEVLCVCFASASTFGNKRRRPGRFENVYLPTKRQEIMLEVGGGWNVRAGSRFEKNISGFRSRNPLTTLLCRGDAPPTFISRPWPEQATGEP